jgi:hypothetical protein
MSANADTRDLPATLRVSADRTVHRGEWDSSIAALDGCLFHASGWSDYRAVDRGAKPLFVRWRDTETGSLVAAAVATLQTSGPRAAAHFTSSLLIDSPPATRHPGLDFVRPLLTWAQHSSAAPVKVHLGSFDATCPWRPEALPHANHRYEFLVADESRDDLLRAMRKGTRSAIKRGARLGVQVRTASTPSDLWAFLSLYEETAERLARTKGIRPNISSRRRRFAGLNSLVEANLARLYLALRGDEPIAGCLFGTWNGTAYYLQNGAADVARTTSAVHVTLHRALSDFVAADFRRINLGGVAAAALSDDSPDHGLYQFKRGFGAIPEAREGASVVLRPRTAQVLSSAHDAANSLLNASRRVRSSGRRLASYRVGAVT